LEADRIRLIRMALGESQAAFGRRLKIPQPTICRWEEFGLPTRAIYRGVEAQLRRLERDLARKGGRRRKAKGASDDLPSTDTTA
jgi:transcriptional regulator with XRE-family HTH domain